MKAAAKALAAMVANPNLFMALLLSRVSLVVF
jgi:hypothetical protein